MDPTVPVDQLEENEKLNKYLDLYKRTKKIWDKKVTVIPITVGALGREMGTTEIG